jgi:hypothetical protein
MIPSGLLPSNCHLTISLNCTNRKMGIAFDYFILAFIKIGFLKGKMVYKKPYRSLGNYQLR